MLASERLKFIDKPLKGAFGFAAKLAVLPAIAGTIQYFFARKNIQEELDGLKASYSKSLSISDKMSANPDKAAGVFRELCAVAPSIAMNPNMAVKVIEPRLKTGLTIDDVHKLTMINANTKQSIFSKTPFGEASRSAGLVADRVFTTFGSKVVDDFVGAAKARTHRHKAWDKIIEEANSPDEAVNKSREYPMDKQSSQKVSESCAAEMMADRYLLLKNSSLYKEAGAMSGAADVLAKAAPYLIASLAMAGIAHGVGAGMDALQRKKLENQADDAYAKLRKNSEIVKANPDIAHEAFDAIKTFAPNLAAKQNILKTFIEHSVSMDGRMPPETINQLATAQGNIIKSKQPGFAGGFSEATHSMGTSLKGFNDPKSQSALKTGL